MIEKLDILSFSFDEHSIVWDVRDEIAYNEAHVKGAMNMPIDGLSVHSLHNIPSNQPIYILCGGGLKAPRAAELLDSLDNSRTYFVLEGGTRVAKSHGLPIVYAE